MQRIDQIASQLDVLSPPMQDSRMHQFARICGCSDYDSLHRWSVENPGNFWTACWKFLGVRGVLRGPALVNAENMIEAKFFPESEINFAENILHWAEEKPEEPALVFVCEGGEPEGWSWAKLKRRVGEISDLLKAIDVKFGDRVCAIAANTPDTVAAMLATVALGAVWSSVSPDFGVQGVCERFEQLEPKVLFAHSEYYMKGKRINVSEVLEQVKKRLNNVSQAFVLNFNGFSDSAAPAGWETLDAAVARRVRRSANVVFARTTFNDPCFILFSSGTTGKPKCIVHKHGVLLQLKKEHVLHSDMREGERVFYYTTTTWMMWHWLVGTLATGVTVYLWEGAVFHPSPSALVAFCAKYRLQHFGVSAKYVESLAKAAGSEIFPQTCIRNLYSTGSVLSEVSFDFLYRKFGGSDFRVNSISGGTDILSCFLLGCPMKPVRRGRLQCAGLGMDVRVFVDGRFRADGVKGELVCATAFVSQPAGFWDAAKGGLESRKYAETYFRSHEGKWLWFHGDFVATDGSDRQFVVFGRSDATLKPGGVRIGTSEIYRALETLKEVKDGVCVEVGGEVRLFVVFQDERSEISEDERNNIRNAIRAAATRHHVPARVEAVKDVPRTRNGKLAELAVKAVLEGRTVENLNALANPESIEFYKKFRL